MDDGEMIIGYIGKEPNEESALLYNAKNIITPIYNDSMFYKQIILQRGLPFEMKIPSARPIDMSALSEAGLDAELDAELEKGYTDMKADRILKHSLRSIQKCKCRFF